jgi:alpha-beta hydrolase superfamily lysophospholipase
MFVAAAALALCGPALAHPGHAPAKAQAAAAPETLTLPVSNGRSLPVSLWNGAGKGPVVIFLHGMGGEPAAYRALFDRWVADGITVVAPTEPDSHSNPDFAKIDLPTGFGMRTEDMMVTRGYVAQRFAGRKVFLAGHSYGSLFAMMGGGAITAAGPLSGPPIAGVVAFSSPGKIPGVVQPTTFASMKAPLLLFTGTEDTVPGFVPNATDHRFAFDTAAPGDKMLVTFKGGNHDLVARPGKPFDTAAALSARFIDAYAKADPKAEAAVRAFPSTADLTVEVR